MTGPKMQQFYTSMLKQEMNQRAVLFRKLVEAYGDKVLDIVEENIQTLKTIFPDAFTE